MAALSARELQNAYMTGTGLPVRIESLEFLSSYGRYGIAGAGKVLTDFNSAPLGQSITFDYQHA